MTTGPTTARAWCQALGHQCVFVNGTVISQPSSSIIGIVLGLVYIASGVFTLRANAKRGPFWAWTKGRDETGFGDQARERCCALYGACLLIWGFALFAATASYQAFTYQLQCEDLDTPCVDPKTMEVLYDVDVNGAASVYLLLQTIGHYCLVVGDACRALRRYLRPVIVSSVIVTALYALWCFTVTLHGYTDLYSASLVIALPSLVAQGLLNSWVRARLRATLPPPRASARARRSRQPRRRALCSCVGAGALRPAAACLLVRAYRLVRGLHRDGKWRERGGRLCLEWHLVPRERRAPRHTAAIRPVNVLGLALRGGRAARHRVRDRTHGGAQDGHSDHFHFSVTRATPAIAPSALSRSGLGHARPRGAWRRLELSCYVMVPLQHTRHRCRRWWWWLSWYPLSGRRRSAHSSNPALFEDGFTACVTVCSTSSHTATQPTMRP
jgi:hypothetical protein